MGDVVYANKGTSGFADGSISTEKLADDSVTNAKLNNITQGSVKVGGAADAPTDLDASTDAQILVGDGTDIASVAVSGDIALINTGAVTIQEGAVEDSMIEGLTAGQIILGVDGTAANNLKDVLSGDVTMDGTGAVTIAADSVENSMLANITRGSVKVGGASDAPTDYDAKTSGQILVGDSTDIISVAVSGDVTLASGGAVTIGTDKILPSMRNIGDYIEFFDDFAGAAPDEVAKWNLQDTSGAGAPTSAMEADETAVTMTLAANDEVEVLGHNFGDKLQFNIDNNPIFIARFKVPTIAANQEAVIGMCAAWADTLDNNVAHAWFRLKANMDLLLETDDNGAVDESEDSTVNMTADTYLWVKIDFADTADVLFYTGTDGKAWTARAPKTFNMSNYTAGLQPAFAILKSAGVTQPTITVDVVKVMADRP